MRLLPHSSLDDSLPDTIVAWGHRRGVNIFGTQQPESSAALSWWQTELIHWLMFPRLEYWSSEPFSGVSKGSRQLGKNTLKRLRHELPTWLQWGSVHQKEAALRLQIRIAGRRGSHDR